MFHNLIFAILVLLSLQLTLADWRFPYFIDSQTEGVYFYDWKGIQEIRVREELSLPFVLAEINYEGVGEPNLGSLDVGNKNLLGANITKMDGKWLIMIENRQDYENKEQQIYSFQIFIHGVMESGLSQYGILMILENIFDNIPVITYQPSPCRVQELRADYVTNCSFTVYDPDGIEMNNIRLVVNGRNEANTFEFLEYEEETPQPLQKTFLLRIKKELHYDQHAIYNLTVSAYDANNNSGSIFAILEVTDLPNRDPIWLRPLTIVEKREQINVRATDGGDSSSEEIRHSRLVFVDMLGNPRFLENNFSTTFTEGERGLAEERFIPEAYDSRNEAIDAFSERFNLYYFIDESFRPDEAKLFSLHKASRLLRLRRILDREAIDTLQLRIKVSNDTNNENGFILNPNSVNYTLDIFITVNDVNDKSPTFLTRSYVAGITSKDTIGKEFLVFHAVDPDLDDPTSYVLDTDSFRTRGENIEQAKFQLFSLNNSSGELILRSYIMNNMKGYFLFDVVAYDTAEQPHVDKVPVVIYIISEANRVKFVFLNDVQGIRKNEQFIREEFQKMYNYSTCNVDAIEDVTNQQQRELRDTSDGVFITKVIVHFINNNVAVEAIDIQKRASDLVFIFKLQNTLQQRNLILNDIPHLSLDEGSSTIDDWLLIILIVISVLLVALCTILMLACVHKTRALNRQVKAFQSIQFGSMDSNLSHKNATTANIFSTESSIQGFRKFPTFDDHEDEKGFSFSSDSDSEDYEFSGLQDDPMFDINIFKINKMTGTEKDYAGLYYNSEIFNLEVNQDVNEKIRY